MLWLEGMHSTAMLVLGVGISLAIVLCKAAHRQTAMSW
jgi:hypothetical protein